MAEKKDAELRWYVLRVFSGKEKKVKENFESEIRNGNFGKYLTEVVLPTENVVSVKNGKKVTKEHVLTPGYVLVRAALVEDVAFRIQNASNVMGFLSDDQKTHVPTPIQDDEAMRMMGHKEEVSDTFEVGEVVKIIDGPFVGGEGEVDEVFLDRQKLKLNVKMFGRMTPIEVDFMQVEKGNGVQ